MNYKEFVIQEETIDEMNKYLEQALPEVRKFIVENIDFFLEDNYEDMLKNIRIFTEVATQSLLSNISASLYKQAVQTIQEAEQEVSKYL